MLLQIVFWTSIFLVLQTYLFFPWVLKLIASNKLPNQQIYAVDSDTLPEIAVLMAVYNEEVVIEKKIHSVYNSDYPTDKIRFYIGSDNSSDKTNAIIRKLQETYPSLSLKVFEQRTGKIAIINQLELDAQEEILILTDANVYFGESTIYELVKHYKNPEIALVGGNIVNEQYKIEGISFQEKKYLERENLIKYHEGIIWGTMIGALGGLFSIRKNAFSPVPSNFLVDDFYISMHTLATGKKVITELDAIAYEDVSNKITEEFRRKVRISAGNYQNLVFYKKLLWPPFSGLAFSFFSHKVLRWITPFLLLLAFVTNLYLLPVGKIYQFTLLGQIGVLLIPVIDVLLKKIAINLRVFRFITHFYSMNLALLVGFFKYSTGIKTNIWQPTERNQ
jgi:cellulose synthase/poly-beta-1,6-N-acetylglucosamine synthase-like glycosyltransferase